MLGAKSHGDMTVPAHGHMCLQCVRYPLRGDRPTFESLTVGAKKGRLMVQQSQLLELLLAVNTTSALIPFLQDVPDQAVLGSQLDLTQAFPTAALTFRPSRATAEM